MKNTKKHAFSVPHLSADFYVTRNRGGLKMLNDLFVAEVSGVRIASGRDIKSTIRKATTRLEKLSQSDFDSALSAELTKAN
tara:strand:+ start:294 stop:536 length:243 start_codon:yes stop_codon:yes gene_type:complete